MAIDREATLKKAEKLLRQGKLDGAIEEYVRLVEDQPRDWSSINALGDLYIRGGDPDRAVAQFTRVADHLFEEGFLARAAALYKKALKVRSDHEHTLLRLGEVAARQGLLADAKMYLGQLAQQRRLRGDAQGAADCVARIAALDLQEPESGPAPAAAAPPAKPAAAAPAASSEPAAEDPDLLVALAQMELAAERDDRARAALTRLVAIAPDRHADITRMALEQARQGRIDSALACIDIVVDAALLDAHWERAVGALQAFVTEVPYIPSLIKLVELCVDAGLEAPLRDAQGRLADAYLDAEQGNEARVIAEDLLEHEPASEAHRARLRRALELLGTLESTSGIDVPAPPSAAAMEGERLAGIEPMEIDLSGALREIGANSLAGAPPLPPSRPEPVPQLESIFEGLRGRAAGDEQAASAAAQYERGLAHLRAGRMPEAIADLQGAARAPLLRFAAARQLGSLYVSLGELQAGVDWMERAAEAPAPTPDEASAVLYDLASVLERLGEPARALAVLMVLEADAAGYRDVRRRIEELTRQQTGSRGQ